MVDKNIQIEGYTVPWRVWNAYTNAIRDKNWREFGQEAVPANILQRIASIESRFPELPSVLEKYHARLESERAIHRKEQEGGSV